MNDNKIAIGTLLVIVVFGLGLFAGYKMTYGQGCPKCVEETPAKEDNKRETTSLDLIKEYSIINLPNSGIATSGYKVEKVDDYYLVTIAMGTFNTGGYYLSVKSVTETADKTIIVVKSNSPGISDIVTQAFTTPAITMHVKTENVEVVSDTGRPYELLKESR